MNARPRRWRLTAVAALLLLVAAPVDRAMAQDDPYSATVTVDATSDSVAKARDVARLDGARRALDAVVAKLAGGGDKTKLPKLSDNQVTDLVASFEVANEKMSAVRYTADYTYHFKRAEVDRVLQSAGIAVNLPAGAPNAPPGSPAPAGSPATSGGAGKPVVVLPIYQDGGTALLWDDPNPWREAWSARPLGTGGTLLMVPLGDVSDVAAIDADKARQGDAAALAAIAKKEGADDVLVTVALRRSGGKPGLDVTVRHYHAGQFVDVHTDSVDANPGEDDVGLFRRAVDTIAGDIDTGWKNARPEPSGPPASLEVVAAITSLDDWIKLRDTLSSAPSVRKIEVKALSRQEATIEVDYAGSIDQLKAAFASVQLDLEGGDPVWRLGRAGAKP